MTILDGSNSKGFSTSATNRQFPTLMECAVTNSSVAGTVTEFFSIKTNKYVNLSTSQDIAFDVIGVWLDDGVTRDLFEKTPMYMRDFHEGPSTPYSEDEKC